MKSYFFKKESRKTVPVEDVEINRQAQIKLSQIFENRTKFNIPEHFLKNWHNVALYDPKGSVDKAQSLLVNPEDGAYNLKNKINDLTGKEWVKFSCSWFIFNALKNDLDAEKQLDPKMEEHPATYSPTMIANFIRFFTKKGNTVLDPFCGIGSTLEACKRTQRIGYGVELNTKYYRLCLKRTPEFKDNIFNEDATTIQQLNLPKIDFCIASPPYWNILNRSTHTFRSDRRKHDLDVNYSNSSNDLGNIDDYDCFLEKLSNIYFNVYDLLRHNAYTVIIIKNVKKAGKIYPLAWDLAKVLSQKYVLKDEKIWIQDKIGLAPYGYPFSWTSNILHHYCLVFRKEK